MVDVMVKIQNLSFAAGLVEILNFSHSPNLV